MHTDMYALCVVGTVLRPAAAAARMGADVEVGVGVQGCAGVCCGRCLGTASNIEVLTGGVVVALIRIASD